MNTVFKSFLFVFCAVMVNVAQAQKAPVTPKGKGMVMTSDLNQAKIDGAFTADVKQKLGIDFAIHKVIKCSDKEGEYYFVFTSNRAKPDPIYHIARTTNIILYKVNLKAMKVVWKIDDALVIEKDEFFYKQQLDVGYYFPYTFVHDIDSDGYLDPIFSTYTEGLKGVVDGTMKMMIFYKNEKYTLKHFNSEDPKNRLMQIEKKYYNLPQSVKDVSTKILTKIAEDKRSIFPTNWVTSIKAGKTEIKN